MLKQRSNCWKVAQSKQSIGSSKRLDAIVLRDSEPLARKIDSGKRLWGCMRCVLLNSDPLLDRLHH